MARKYMPYVKLAGKAFQKAYKSYYKPSHRINQIVGSKTKNQDSENVNAAHTFDVDKIHLGPYKKRPLAKYIKIEPQNYKFDDGSINITSGVGKQSMGTFVNMYDAGQLNALLSFAPDSTAKLYLEYVVMDWEFCNMGNTPCELIIYWSFPKSNLYDGVDDTIKNGLLSKFGISTANQFPYMKPEYSIPFLRDWRVSARKVYHLAPGEVKKVHVFYNIQKMYYNAMIDGGGGNNGNPTPYWKNGTLVTHYILRGTTSGLASGGGGTFAAAEVAATLVSKRKYRYPTSNTKVSSNNSAANTLPTTAPKVVVPETGVVGTGQLDSGIS